MNRTSTPPPPARAALAGRAGGTAAALGAILTWCFSGVCYAAGARAIGAMPFLSLSCAIGVATIICMRWARGASVLALVRIPYRVMFAGFWGVAVYSVMLVGALGLAEKRDLGHIMLLNYLWPIWIILLGMLMLDTKVRPAFAIAGAILGFGGLALSLGLDQLHHAPASLLPHLMALIGGFLWALYSVLLRRWKIPAESGGSTFHFAVCGILAALLAAIAGQWRHLASLDGHAIAWLILGGVGPVGLGYYWWEIGIKRGPIHLIALLAFFIPIGSTALIALFYREALSPWLLPAAALITAGAVVGQRGGEKDDKVRG